MKILITYDPSNHNEPLKAELPVGTNPNLAILLLSQVITGLSMSQVAGNPSGLIMPATNLPKAKM